MMDSGILSIAGTDKSFGADAHGQAHSVSTEGSGDVGSFGSMLDQVEADAPPPASPLPVQDDPTQLVLAVLQLGQTAPVLAASDPAAVAVSPLGEDQQAGVDLAGSLHSAFGQAVLFGSQEQAVPSSGQTQPLAPWPGAGLQSELAAATVDSAIATVSPQTAASQELIQPQDQGSDRATAQQADLISAASLSPAQSGELSQPSVANEARSGDQPAQSTVQPAQSAMTRPETYESATAQVRHEQSPEVQGLQGTKETVPPGKDVAPESRNQPGDAVEGKTGETRGMTETAERAGTETAGREIAFRSEDKGKEPGEDMKGPAVHQETMGADRYLVGAARAEGPRVEASPSSPPPTPVTAVQSEPLTPPTRPSIQVEVHPGEVGPVQVRVALADQTVHASVTTQRAEVREFLVTNQGRLEAGLNASGLTMGEFQVDVDSRGRGAAGYVGYGWSFGPGRDSYGQGREQVPYAQQAEPPLDQAVGPLAWTGEGRGLSLFA
jgi:flagellar hook-length control protein FliK